MALSSSSNSNIAIGRAAVSTGGLIPNVTVIHSVDGSGRPILQIPEATMPNVSSLPTLGTTAGQQVILPPHLQHHHFTTESIKMIAESVGIANLGDMAAKLLADNITNRLKQVVLESVKFTHHAKRRKLLTTDVDYGLRCLNVEPVYGFSVDSREQGLPFRFASGGGRELIFPDAEKEIDLVKLATSPILPKVPPDVALKAHWLAIEGVQPAIPDNPPPVSKPEQRLESIDPLAAAVNASASTVNPHAVKLNEKLGLSKKKRLETVKVKQYATHELSVEQQLYYKEITEACVGSDEQKRSEALHSLAGDSGLHQMLPRLCTFISEGVKVNVVQNNLALLIYLMRMVKAILDNPTLYLEKYLHELLPTITTCVVSKQLCLRPDVDNHWALRDFAARLLAQTCRAYNTATNSIQVRLTRVLTKALDSQIHLSSVYGALSGLCELGPDVQRALVFKRIRLLGERIQSHDPHSGMSMGEFKAAVDHIKTLVVRTITSTIKATRPGPDILDDYKQEFGLLFGQLLFTAVTKTRASIVGQGGLGQPGVTVVTGQVTGTTVVGQGGQQQRVTIVRMVRP